MACGSIRGRTQYVSVDSKPRGVIVYDKKGENLGPTPLFHKIESRSHLTFEIDQEGDQASSRQVIGCQFQWLQTPLENLPLPLLFLSLGLPIAASIYGTALITDVLSGAAYHCPDQIKLSNFKDKKKSQSSCPRYLRAGLTALSRQAQNQITSLWWARRSQGEGEHSHSKDQKCGPTLVEDKEVWAHQLDLSLDHFGDDLLKEWSDDVRRINRLGYETQASHLLHLSYVDPTQEGLPSTDEKLIKVTELDLHTLHTFSLLIPQPIEVLSETESVGHNVRSFFKHSSSLIPDTLGISFMLRSYDGISHDGESNQTEQSSRGLTLTHVSHPNAFRSWDYAFNFNLGGGLDLAQRFTLEDRPQTRVSFNRYTLDAMFNLTGHTPLGAIGLSVGPGLGVYQLSDPRLNKDLHLIGEFNVGIHYTFFVTEKIMGRFKANTIQVGGSIGEKVFSEITDIAFMIGYYVPSLQRLTHDLLDDSP